MKKALKLALLATVISSASGAALAGDGTINFTGKITDTTCTVKVNNGTATNVTLPTVNASSLATADQHAGDANFTISLQGCKKSGSTGALAGVTNTASVYFEKTATVSPAGTLINQSKGPSAATNVDLQVLEDGGTTPVSLGDSGQLASAKKQTFDASGNATLKYLVRYHSTGTATAGDVTSSAVYDINYN